MDSEEHLESLENKINLFSSYFINPKEVVKILAKYPHFNHYGVSLFTDCGIIEDDISTVMNQQLYSINKKMTKIQRKVVKDYSVILRMVSIILLMVTTFSSILIVKRQI